MIRAFAALLLLWPGVLWAQLTNLDATEKSMFFAGRCLAPVLLREDISTKDLQEMPATAAVGHLYGKDGSVWYGVDDSVVLVVLSEGASCGINVFDEELATVEAFMTYWLEREDSPFGAREVETLASGDIRISYDGFCKPCGYNVHARALWLSEARFTIYRVYATLPEKV